MPDIYYDVDAALSEVPANIFPLTDDTDFKTRETAVAYNATGMDLVWNFVTTAGAYTQTAVTPTTNGTYDWTHQGDAMYSIEIPASGGASINNDTEGFGWFTGVATGVLPWRSPIFGFRASAINDSLIDAGGTGLLAPTVAARTLDVTASGNAGIDLDNIALTNGCGPFGIQASGTLSGTHSATTADLGTNAPASTVVGMTLIIPTRVFAKFITAHDTGTGVVTFDATGATLTNGDQWYLVGTPTTSSALPIPADLTRINGSAQDATDLADFAASGYDPATNKVEGVKLADTVTTLTGHTPQTGDSYARIGATGSGLTSLATQASVNTIDDFLDTEVAAIKAVTDNLPNSGTLSSLATAAAVTALQTTLNTSRYIKNTVSQKVYFVMVLSSDHVSAATGITVTAQRSLDGAAFGSATGAVTEIGNGLYYLSTSAADTNADDVVFRFTGTACDPVQIHIPTAS